MDNYNPDKEPSDNNMWAHMMFLSCQLMREYLKY